MSRDILFPCRKRLDRRHGGWWNNLAKTHKPHCPKNQQLQQQQDDWRGRQSKKKACSSQKRSPTVVYRRDDHQDWGKGIKVNVVQSGASDCEKGFVNCFLRVLQAVGLYCSCRAAQARKDNFQKTFYQSFFHNLTHIYSARIVLPYKKTSSPHPDAHSCEPKYSVGTTMGYKNCPQNCPPLSNGYEKSRATITTLKTHNHIWMI